MINRKGFLFSIRYMCVVSVLTFVGVRRSTIRVAFLCEGILLLIIYANIMLNCCILTVLLLYYDMHSCHQLMWFKNAKCMQGIMKIEPVIRGIRGPIFRELIVNLLLCIISHDILKFLRIFLLLFEVVSHISLSFLFTLHIK